MKFIAKWAALPAALLLGLYAYSWWNINRSLPPRERARLLEAVEKNPRVAAWFKEHPISPFFLSDEKLQELVGDVSAFGCMLDRRLASQAAGLWIKKAGGSVILVSVGSNLSPAPECAFCSLPRGLRYFPGGREGRGDLPELQKFEMSASQIKLEDGTLLERFHGCKQLAGLPAPPGENSWFVKHSPFHVQGSRNGSSCEGEGESWTFDGEGKVVHASWWSGYSCDEGGEKSDAGLFWEWNGTACVCMGENGFLCLSKIFFDGYSRAN